MPSKDLIVLLSLYMKRFTTFAQQLSHIYCPMKRLLHQFSALYLSIQLFSMVAAVIHGQSALAQISQQLPEHWPNIPLISIHTVNGEMPTCERAQTPEGCVGTTITNNNYVPGRMVMTLRGDTLYDSKDYVADLSGMRLKIRGNSSGAFLDQKPYKLKLSKKADLLCRGRKAFRNKNWALMSYYIYNPSMPNHETNLIPLFAHALARYVGMPWQPEGRFVNVVINDQYRGIYLLLETVDKGDSRINVAEDGFIIENDPFWWSEDDKNFRTHHQMTHMRYTYNKYMPGDGDRQEAVDSVRDYMNRVEDAIWERKDLSDLIDFTTFTRWIVSHDLLAVGDATGSNTYLYCESMNSDGEQSKLRMGPIWDLDSSYNIPFNIWGLKHTYYAAYYPQTEFYYPKLFEIPQFVEAYKETYAQIRPHIVDQMQHFCDSITELYSQTLEESAALHRTIYPYEAQNTIPEQTADLMDKFRRRIAAVDSLIAADMPSTGISATTITRPQSHSRFDLTGRNVSTIPFTQLPAGVYIETSSDGTTRKVMKR